MNNFLEHDFSFDGFHSASQAVINYLHKRFGFGLWMITRTEGEDWIVLQAKDTSYGVNPGSVFRWADSFCSRMVKGEGPCIAPSSDLVPAYANAPIAQQFPIQAYIGMPLTNTDGSIFGTLCAIDPNRQPDSIVQEQETVELFATLLSTILRTELKLDQEVRRSERLEIEAYKDPLTQLANRRAWDQLLAKEESRCQRYGHSAAIIMIDLDDLKPVNDAYGHAAGDALIMRTADVLRKAMREEDVVARLGGDEFGIIAVELEKANLDMLVTRVRNALAEHQINASVGAAIRIPSVGLKGAMENADRLMYEEKSRKYAHATDRLR